MNYKDFSIKINQLNKDIEETTNALRSITHYNPDALVYIDRGEGKVKLTEDMHKEMIAQMIDILNEWEQEKDELITEFENVDSPLRNSVERLCLENGISVSSLEKRLGFGNSSIRRWDSSNPSIDKVLKVADYFGVTIDSLFERGSLFSAEKIDLLDLLSEDKRVFIDMYELDEHDKEELSGLLPRLY